MSTVIDEARNVVFRHLGQLLLKNAFEAGKNYETFAFVIIVHNLKFDLAVALFEYSGLWSISTAGKLPHWLP